MSVPPTILIVANEPWGEVWFSKQHYAAQLNLLGHPVLFLEPSEPWRPSHLWCARVRMTEVREGLRVVRLRNRLPNRYFRRVNDRMNEHVIGRLVGPGREVIWWQFDPLRYVPRPSCRGARRIYHVVDPYHMFSTDREVAVSSDLIVVVNEQLLAAYADLTVPKVVIPHGLDPEEHVIDPQVLEVFRKEHGEGHLLFVGTVNVDVDLALLEAVADALPGERLMLVGPVHPSLEQGLERLLNRPNVYWAGPRPASVLKYFVALSKVCLVPYKVSDDPRGRTPLKVMNYLAHGRPVVSTVPLPLDPRLPFSMARTHLDLIEVVRSLVAHPPVVEPGVIEAFRAEHAYPRLIRRILDRLDEVTRWERQ